MDQFFKTTKKICIQHQLQPVFAALKLVEILNAPKEKKNKHCLKPTGNILSELGS